MTKKCKSLFINLLTSIYSHIKTVDVKEIISLLDGSVCGKFRSNQIMTKVLVYLQGVTALVPIFQLSKSHDQIMQLQHIINSMV